MKLARSLGALALAAAMTLEAGPSHAAHDGASSTWVGGAEAPPRGPKPRALTRADDPSTPPRSNRKRELRSSGIALLGLGTAAALCSGFFVITGLATTHPGSEARRLELTAGVGLVGFAGLAFAGGIPLFVVGAPAVPKVSAGPRGVALAWSF